MAKYIVFFVLLMFQSKCFAAYVRYGGFFFEKTNKSLKSSQSVCLNIIEISPYERGFKVYSKDEFFSLIASKELILKHISKSLGLSKSKLEFAANNLLDDPVNRSKCISPDDLLPFVSLQARKIKKNDKFYKLASKTKSTKVYLLQDKTATNPLAWSNDLFDQYIIKDYLDPIEEAEKKWKSLDRYFVSQNIDDSIDVLNFLKKSVGFLVYYKNLGRVVKVVKKNKSKVKGPLEKSFHLPKTKKLWTVSLQRDEKLDLIYSHKVSKINKNLNFPVKKKVNKKRTSSDSQEENDMKFCENLSDLKSAYYKKLINLSLAHKKMKSKSEYARLTDKIHSGSYSRKELKEFRVMRSKIDYGIRQGKKNKTDKVKNVLKKSLMFYNFYATDTIVDKYMDFSVSLTLEQLLPMSKKRYAAYRLSKFGDGFFVLSTSCAGLALAPFTMGLSVLVASGINVATTGFFSIATSLTRNEPLDSLFVRFMLRSFHTFGESFVPIWTETNAFFTSIDDLRVAGGLDQKISNFIKNRNLATMVRPESLGKPFVLDLLRERIDYLEQVLLPYGKKILDKKKLNSIYRIKVEKNILKIQEARNYLKKALLKSALRYQYLLERGKIPNQMLYEVSSKMKAYHVDCHEDLCF